MDEISTDSSWEITKMHQRAVITNAKFIYKKEESHLKGKLKYFQHRDDRDTHLKQHDNDGNPIRRWEDRGLGDNYLSIAQNCAALATSGLTNDVGARTLVISPQVEMMQAIPEEMRMAIAAELTEATVEKWFEAMNLPTPEYSYVVHKGEVKNDRPEEISQEDREFVHTHVILAATVPGLSEERENYKVYNKHLDQLHQIGNQEMERIWTRELGHERVQELNNELEELTKKLAERDAAREAQQREAEQLQPHEVDKTMLELYNTLGIEPPEELAGRVQARMEIETNPIDELKALGWDLPEDSPYDQLEVLGFEFPDDQPLEVDQTAPEIDEIMKIYEELGFELPRDEQELDGELDVIETYRTLGFEFPGEETYIEDRQNLITMFEDIGFELPGDEIDHQDMDDSGAVQSGPELEIDFD